MAYCTQSDIELYARPALVIEWSDDDGDGVADSSVVTAAITWADNEINACLANLYADYLPFTALTLPGVIKNISVTFAAYRLAYRSQTDQLTDKSQYAKEYDEARKRLKRICEGKDKLIDDSGSILPPSGGSSTGNTAFSPDADPIYSKTTLACYSDFS